MERNVSPGLFHLPLPVNRNVSKDAIRRKVIDIEHDLKQKTDRPEELAILNLLGLFKFRLEEYEDAEAYFRKILSKDEHNLNALANMQHVLQECDRSWEANAFKHKWASLQRGEMPRARCLAEQAYVYACDLHTDEGHQDRFIKSNDIFQEAIDLAGDSVGVSEKDMWKYCMAINSHKIFNNSSFKYNRGLAMEHMEKAVKLFHEITQREAGDSRYKWDSWRNLADIFRKLQTRLTWGTGDLSQDLKRFIDDPEECMRKAMEISPNNPKLLARYGNFVFTLSRERSKEALELLNRSISLDESEANYYAFSTRGKVLLGKLDWQMRKSKKGDSYRPLNKSMKEMAMNDIERAIKFRNAVFDLMNMADLYHLMAQTSVDESEETRRKYLEKELMYLRRASNSEGGEGKQYANKRRGRCLFDLGEYREAVSCYKEANENLSKTAPYVGYFHEMFRSYLCLLRSESEQASDNSTLLREMADSLRQAVGKHGVANLINYCFSPLQAEFPDELLLLTEHCEKIPSNELMLEVLKSKEPPSPLSPPVRKGGSLAKTWKPEPNQSTTPDSSGSASSAEGAVKPTLGSIGKGMSEFDDPQPQGEPRVECTTVTKREDSGDLATPAKAGIVATTQSGPGQLVQNIINIHATNSPLNFGTTHGMVNKYELPMTEGRRGEVSSKEIEMLTQLKTALGEEDLGKLMSEGLKHVQQQGGLPISSADTPSQTLAICDADEPSANSRESRLSADDATSVPEGAVASVARGIGNIDIKGQSAGNSAKPAPQMQE